MLGFFPTPYPDELLYSICARYQARMNYSSQSSTVLDLFETKKAIAIFDLPSKLQRLLASLPPGHDYTVDQFIDNHTLKFIRAWELSLDSLKCLLICASVQCVWEMIRSNLVSATGIVFINYKVLRYVPLMKFF
jgi:hypothetical protein